MYHVTWSVHLEFVCPLFSFFNPEKKVLQNLGSKYICKFIYIPAGIDFGLLEGPQLIVSEARPVSSPFGSWVHPWKTSNLQETWCQI